MAWIPIMTEFPRHRKVRKLADALGISVPQALGHVVAFWCNVLDLQPLDGNISKWTKNDICVYSGWTGDPEKFFKAMTNDGDGFIDVTKNGMFVHDWIDYTYRYLKTRFKTSHPEYLKKLKTTFRRTEDRLQTPDRIREDRIREDKSKYSAFFEELWKKYPERVGKKLALRNFNSSVKTDQDVTNIKIAIENYIKSPRVAKGYIQNAATWFNNWEDWVDYKSSKNEGIWGKVEK